MNNYPEGKHRLNIPDGKKPIPSKNELADMLVESQLATPEILDEIAGHLATIALYHKKAGLAQGILTNEDIEELEGGGDESGKPDGQN